MTKSVLWILLSNEYEKKDELPSSIQDIIKKFISETTEQSLNLVVNISGVYLDKDKRKQFREKVKQETAPELEEYITKNILLGKELAKESQIREVNGVYAKEKIYLIFELASLRHKF